MIVLGMREMIPKKLKRLTSRSAMRSSHVADTQNPMRVIGTAIDNLGGTSPQGAKRRTISPRSNGRTKTRHTAVVEALTRLTSN
jgi:hypothetical protein